MNYSNILVVNLGGIGDILLSTPALRALKDSFPKTEISILVVPRVREIAVELPFIDKVYVFYPGCSLINLFKDFFTLVGLRKRRFDLLINMRTIVSKISAAKIKILLYIINPKIRAGRDTEGRGEFFDIKINETDLGEKYEMEYDIEMAQALGADIVDRKLKFEFSAGDLMRVKRLLGDSGICVDDIIVGINPGGILSRRWPVENFVKTIKEINKRIKCKFVITGVGRDIDLVNKIKIKVGINIANAADRLNLKELGALISICRLYISNDSGPMHIAAILNTPLVAIFGPAHLNRFDPRNISNQAIVLKSETPCAPCNRKRCDDLFCLKKITPEKVIEESVRFLRRSIK